MEEALQLQAEVDSADADRCAINSTSSQNISCFP